jgi:hypothetical protein
MAVRPVNAAWLHFLLYLAADQYPINILIEREGDRKSGFGRQEPMKGTGGALVVYFVCGVSYHPIYSLFEKLCKLFHGLQNSLK